jgi:hypothetical protein
MKTLTVIIFILEGITTMNYGMVKNIPITEGEITIVKAEDAAEIMEHSCGLAAEIRKEGVGVMVINTGLSPRRFKAAAIKSGIECGEVRDSNTLVAPGPAPCIIHTAIAGDLASQVPDLTTVCKEAKIKIVIVTSWEWTSSNYRRKEQLLFALRQLVSGLDVALVVYSQSSTQTSKGRYDRGGTGKLAMLALEVLSLEAIGSKEEQQTDLDAFKPVYVRKEKTVVRAQLSAKEINRLQGKIAGSDGASAEHRGQRWNEEDDLVLAA